MVDLEVTWLHLASICVLSHGSNRPSDAGSVGIDRGSLSYCKPTRDGSITSCSIDRSLFNHQLSISQIHISMIHVLL